MQQLECASNLIWPSHFLVALPYLDYEDLRLAEEGTTTLPLEGVDKHVQLYNAVSAVDNARVTVTEDGTDETVRLAVIFLSH